MILEYLNDGGSWSAKLSIGMEWKSDIRTCFFFFFFFLVCVIDSRIVRFFLPLTLERRATHVENSFVPKL